MADGFIQVPVDSTGKKFDTRTESTNSEHRSVMVIGDPSSNAGVAPVDATKGLAVDLTNSGLPTGIASSANQSTANTSLASIDTKTPALGQASASASVPVVLPVAQITTLTPPPAITGFATDSNLTTTNTEIGVLTETAPASDTASSGLNGRLQRIAQRLTSLITALGSPFQAGGALGAGSAIIGKVGIDQTTPGTTNGVQVNAALPTGTNSIGQVTANAGANLNTSALALETGGNLATIVTNTNKIPSKGAATSANATPVTLASDQGTLSAPIFVTDIPNTTGGWNPKSVPALTNTVTGVKASAAGTMGGYQIGNPNSTVTYIQVFDLATTGAVTLGTTTPTYVFSIPGNGTATVGGGGNVEFSKGINHANGIQVAATTTPTGSTAPTNSLCALFLYK